MTRGASARGRRIQRRAAERAAQGVGKAQHETSDVLVAAGNDLYENGLISEDDLRSALMGEVLTASPAVTAVDVLVAAGETMAPTPIATTYDLAYGSVGERRYLSALIDAGYTEERTAAWPCDADLDKHGESLYFRDGEGVFRLDDGTLAHVFLNGGWCHLRLAGDRRDKLSDAVETFTSSYPALFRTPADDTTIPITFWTNTQYGPSSRLRRIDAASWDAIEANYNGEIRDELNRLMTDFTPGVDGQLLLWQGQPGTGKTWALRALASEWSSWAEFSYITDPDSFFVKDPSYMVDVLLHESYQTIDADGEILTEEDPGGKWRVLILEDTGELLSATAKDEYGQGLSRLLNVVDGMVGQGLRVLALVTTNDELGDLHPAAVRPGRCASQITFDALSVEEARAWLAARADGNRTFDEVEAPMTLAELYDLAGGSTVALAQQMDGECACGHMAERHDGDYNDGACMADGCDCVGFKAAEEASDDDGETAAVVTADGTEVGTFTWTTTAKPEGVYSFALQDFVFTQNATGGFEIQVDGPADDRITPAPMTAGRLRWVATLAPEGQATDDGRVFAPGSITWRELPLSLMGMVKTADGHDGAEVCGRIDAIWRDEASGLVKGSGEFDTGNFGAEIARLVGDGTLRGVSVDIAVAKMEVASRSEVLDEDGRWVTQEAPAEDETDEEKSLIDVLFGDDSDVVFVVLEGIIGAATVCPFPAFADANIEIAASLVAAGMPNVWTVNQQAGFTVTQIAQTGEPVDVGDVVEAPAGQEGVVALALTASAAGIAPVSPPADWFAAPEFDELTPLTLDDDGRLYGHAAAWDTCHIGIPGVCTTAPSSNTNYAYYLLKEVVCEDGSRVACGTITIDAPHADRDLGRASAAAHYDNTGVAVADVTVGEDEHGIWFAGALRGDCDEHVARKLRGASLSGDWRDVSGNLELVALLAVNVPGFPVPRPSAALVASGESFKVTTLTAAGIHAGPETVSRKQQHELEALNDLASGVYDELAASVGE